MKFLLLESVLLPSVAVAGPRDGAVFFFPPLRSLRSFATKAFLLAVGLTVLATTALAQTNEIPVAQPASTSATPPAAQPVDQPPIAQPVTPSTPPVAQPVLPTAPTVDQSTNSTTPPVATPVTPAQPPVAQPVAPQDNSTTDTGTGGIVVTTSAAVRFDAAMAFFNGGEYGDAAIAFSGFISDYPPDRHREEALYRLAESYRHLDRPDDALAAYTYQVKSYPDGPLRIHAELQRGAILFDTGKFSDAIPPLQLASTKGDGEVQQAANDLLGRCYLATQKEADGRTLLQALVDQQPPGKFAGDAAQALAELDDSQGKYTDALALWQKAFALSTDPAVQALTSARGGWSALEAKQPDVAEKLFQTARTLNVPGDALKVADTGLLRILFNQKRYTEWLKVHDEATQSSSLLDTAKAEILYDLGQVQFALKNWPEAVSAFDAYLAAFGDQDTAVTAAYQRFLAQTQIDPSKVVTDAEAYLKSWPKSPYRVRVQLLEVQELSREKKFTEALPLWENLATEPANPGWPHQEILLQLARTYDQLDNYPKAATAYQAYLDDLATHPAANKHQVGDVIRVEARLAICLQKSNQLLAATDAWKTVQSQAPDGSKEQQMALESLGLIYARGGPSQAQAEVETFRKLLDTFPNSSLAPLAAFSVGDALFKNHDYAAAETYFLKARNADAKTWMQPATQRLILGAYGMKDYDKTVSFLKKYDTLAMPTDPQAKLAARLPAALFYWLGETARKTGKLNDAEIYYTRVTQHPDPGDLLGGAWWQLGEVQSQLKQWPAAVASYGNYRKIKPDAKDATVVILALGRAQLGAQNFDAAKALGEQALLQEPEGPNSAAARMLLGETAFAGGNYPEAARMFATLAVLFDDPKIAPQAISRAADSFEKAGDAKSTAQWRQKLKDKYPDFQPTPYF
jgi:TolA-binding protein